MLSKKQFLHEEEIDDMNEEARSVFNGKSRVTRHFKIDLGGAVSLGAAKSIDLGIAEVSRQIGVSHGEAAAYIISSWLLERGDFWDSEKEDWHPAIISDYEQHEIALQGKENIKAMKEARNLEKIGYAEEVIRAEIEDAYPGYSYSPTDHVDAVNRSAKAMKMDDLDPGALIICNIFRIKNQASLKGAEIAKEYFGVTEGDSTTNSNKTKTFKNKFIYLIEPDNNRGAGYMKLKPKYAKLIRSANQAEEWQKALDGEIEDATNLLDSSKNIG